MMPEFQVVSRVDASSHAVRTLPSFLTTQSNWGLGIEYLGNTGDGFKTEESPICREVSHVGSKLLNPPLKTTTVLLSFPERTNRDSANTSSTLMEHWRWKS
jgi:hypothetical protein